MRDDKQEPEPGTPDPDGTGGAAPGAAEAEIRRARAFDLATAIGRAGAGNLKGVSPVPASRQALLAIESLLAARLPDHEGSLTRTLLARLEGDPPLLDRHRDRPESALAELLDRTLAVPTALAELVRETDARWGRDFDERPRFESGGRPAAADDPYTVEAVRALLAQLRQTLRP